MKFDFESWEAAVLASGGPTIGIDDLLEAARLIGQRDLDAGLADLLREIEADLDEARRDGGDEDQVSTRLEKLGRRSCRGCRLICASSGPESAD